MRERRRLLNNAVSYYRIESRYTTSPLDFLNEVRSTIIRFIREKPRNKIPINLICEMMRMDPATGDVTNEELASFNSKQESVFGSTHLETMYGRMITKILEAAGGCSEELSGWTLRLAG